MCPQHLGFLGARGPQKVPAAQLKSPVSAADSSAQGTRCLQGDSLPDAWVGGDADGIGKHIHI